MPASSPGVQKQMRCDSCSAFPTYIFLGNARSLADRAPTAYSRPCSIFSWQVMQCFAQGTASRRFCCNSS